MTIKLANPKGFNRPTHKLFGHKSPINRLAWSPSGEMLASPSADRTVKLWDTTQPGAVRHILKGHYDRVNSVTWSPDGRQLASCSVDSNVIIWDAYNGKPVETLRGHNTPVFDVTWSRDGALLAAGYRDGSVVLWDTLRYQRVHALPGHHGGAYCLAWSRNGRWLFVGAADRTIRMWDLDMMNDEILGEHSGPVYHLSVSPDGRRLASASQDNTIQLWGDTPAMLEGHTGAVSSLSFSADSQFLASKALDGKVRIWRCDTLDTVAVLDEPSSFYWSAGLAFHPSQPQLATLTEKDHMIRLWKYQPRDLIEAEPIQQTIRYTNAKVVLVGDKGAGKTKLSDALRGKSFYTPSEPDHERRIWWLYRENRPVEADKLHEMREVMLWDIGGEPAYRVINQLHLNEVALALMVFNSQQVDDPFAGIRYWHRALKHARQVQSDINPIPTLRFLVASQADGGVVKVDPDDVARLQHDLDFDAYLTTSARESASIRQLDKAIRSHIDWDRLPKVSSTSLFQRIKNFLLDKREEGHVLHTMEQLYDTYVDECEDGFADDSLYAEFDTCTRLLSAQGLLKRFSFGNLVLLQPEIVDDYAFAMFLAARQEADGRGFIYEDRALNGDFTMGKGRRLQDQYQEAQMLIATVDDLNKYDVAIRDHDPESGQSILIFPSHVTRSYQEEMPKPDDTTTLWEFDGAVSSIYSTLIARLWRSDLFDWNDMYRGMAFLRTPTGGYYCLALQNLGQGRARLIRFGADDASPRAVMMLDEYIHEHLRRYAVPNSTRRRSAASRRGTVMRNLVRQGWVHNMNQAIEDQHQRDRAHYAVQGKEQVSDFDVFLSYNWEDYEEVKPIADQLRAKHGILPWFDREEVQGGDDWDYKIQLQLDSMAEQRKVMVFFAGRGGVGNTQRDEMAYALESKMNVIPVYLKSADDKTRFPFRISRKSRIDFRQPAPDPETALVRAIRRYNSPTPRDPDAKV